MIINLVLEKTFIYYRAILFVSPSTHAITINMINQVKSWLVR